jgi:23S rRNA (guanine2445-N2)-methyltransferase / 23S rRNA (guanine2069-N7)-methyltransferase
MQYNIFITCPKGLEEVLKREVLDLSVAQDQLRLTVGGLSAQLNKEQLYQSMMQLRCANRISLKLYEHKVCSADDIKQQAQGFDWQTIMQDKHSLSIHFKGQDDQIRNTMFGAQCLKDGISDYFRNQSGIRPSVVKNNPDIQLQANLRKGQLSVYLDILGRSLHQRGYRTKQGLAPLKENVASGLLYLATWPDYAENNFPLIDPCCGSGTFLIEAWQMATHYAPGLAWGEGLQLAWLDFDANHWQRLFNESKVIHQQAALNFTAPIMGFDNDAKMIRVANENIEAAGLSKRIQVSVRDWNQLNAPSHLKKGLVIANPPYGERLSEVNLLLPAYQVLGKQIKLNFEGWRLAVLTAHQKLSKAVGLKSYRQYKVKNGALDCLLSLFEIDKHNQFNPNASQLIPKEGEPLLNRLKKNQSKLKPWLKQQGISSYRLYDADLVEFNAAIDIYTTIDNQTYAHVQEYQAPKSIPEHKVEARLQTLIDVLSSGLGIEREKIAIKQRFRQKGNKQYQRVEQQNQKLIVSDGKSQCYVNLFDYLDTGLFLDHRRLRSQFDQLNGKTFLNLFCYTGVASLHAVRAGLMTTNVDLSKTYLNWAKDNYRLNHHTIDKHQFIHADVLLWLNDTKETYDVIFCDPPSFSNSKRMEGVLDIQRDHSEMIRACMKRLNPKGVLYFSCNLKNFKLDVNLSELYTVVNITSKTQSRDFEGSKIQHQSFKITIELE